MPIEVCRVDFPSALALAEFRCGSILKISVNEASDRESVSRCLFCRARILAILRQTKSISRGRSGLIRGPRRAVNANGVNLLSAANPTFERVHLPSGGIDAKEKPLTSVSQILVSPAIGVRAASTVRFVIFDLSSAIEPVHRESPDTKSIPRRTKREKTHGYIRQ